MDVSLTPPVSVIIPSATVGRGKLKAILFFYP